MSTLGSRIRLVRGEESQSSFAARLEISKGALGFYERDENLPKTDVVLKICALSGVQLDWLLTGNPPMRSKGDAPRALLPEAAQQLGSERQRHDLDLARLQTHCATLEQRLAALEEERRELSSENRNLWKKVCALREEATVLRESQARLESGRRS